MNIVKKICLMLMVLVLVSCQAPEKPKQPETTYVKDETTEVLVDSELKKDDIVKVVKHGDHWHVFTKDGKEHITYTDPSSLSSDHLDLVNVVSLEELKNLKVSAIHKHGDHYHVTLEDGSEVLTYEDPSSLFPNIKMHTYEGDHDHHDHQKEGVQAPKVKDGERVVSILKHGDHYHLYTDQGNEYVTYKDPRSLYPNASYGLYQGSHGSKQTLAKGKGDVLVNKDRLVKVDEKPADRVVAIQRHGDHWHIFTADGREYITHSDPSADYPDIVVGTYTGSHGSNETDSSPILPGTNPLDSLKISNILGQEPVDRYHIVKILKHEDHYHIYDDKGREGIIHSDPSIYFPHIKVEDYGQKDHTDEKPFDWPEGITKIVDHGDHYHLYRGDEEVAVTRQDPRPHYPDAEVIVDHAGSDHTVTDDELFSYDQVEAKDNADLWARLDDNLKSMTDFGDPKPDYPIYGSMGQTSQVFYWLHGSHYHAISIKQLIQMEKEGRFGSYTAKDVVALLKYRMAHPDNKEEEGPVLEGYQVLEFLAKHYGLSAYDSSVMMQIGPTIEIYGEKTLVFYLADFELRDGQVVSKKPLPELPKPAEDHQEG